VTPFATADVLWDTWRRGEQQAVSMDKRLAIPARNTLDLQPQGSRQAASEGGVSVTAWGSRILVGIMSRTAR